MRELALLISDSTNEPAIITMRRGTMRVYYDISDSSLNRVWRLVSGWDADRTDHLVIDEKPIFGIFSL